MAFLSRLLSMGISDPLYNYLPALHVEVEDMVRSGQLIDVTQDSIKNNFQNDSKRSITIRKILNNLRVKDLAINYSVLSSEGSSVLEALSFQMKVDPPVEGQSIKRIFRVTETDYERLGQVAKKLDRLYKDHCIIACEGIIDYPLAAHFTGTILSFADTITLCVGRELFFFPEPSTDEVVNKVAIRTGVDKSIIRLALGIVPKFYPNGVFPEIVVQFLEEVKAQSKDGKIDILSYQNSKRLHGAKSVPQSATAKISEPLDMPLELNGVLVDYTELAEKRAFGPAHFRDKSINDVFASLASSELSNALLYGPAGCGKTHIAEAIASMIAAEDSQVPSQFLGSHVLFLKTNGLMANTGLRGQAEGKIGKLVEFLTTNSDKIILVMDEVANMTTTDVSCGGQSLAQTLLDSIDRGLFPFLGMTTDVERLKMMEKNGTFMRRFNHIYVPPLSVVQTIEALSKDRVGLEKKYKTKGLTISITDEAIAVATHLASIYESEGLPSAAYKVASASVSWTVSKNKGGTITDEDVFAYVADHYSKPLDKVKAEYWQSIGDPTIDLVPKGSVIHTYTENTSRMLRLDPPRKGSRALIHQIFVGLGKPDHRMVFVTGRESVDRTLLIKQAAHEMPNGPPFLKGRALLKLSVSQLVRDIDQQKLSGKDFVDVLEKSADELILYIDRPDEFFGRFNTTCLYDLLKGLIESGKLLVTIEANHNDPAYLEHRAKGTTVAAEELSAKETIEILTKEKDALEKRFSSLYGQAITIDPAVISKVVEVSKWALSGSYPQVAFDLLYRVIGQKSLAADPNAAVKITAEDIAHYGSGKSLPPKEIGSLAGRVCSLMGGLFSSITGLFWKILSAPLRWF